MPKGFYPIPHPTLVCISRGTKMTFYEGKHILVTGGAGAIGWNLVQILARIPECTVTVLDDFSSGKERVVAKNVEYIEGSIVDNAHLEEAFRKKPRVVFHLASHFANQNSVEHPAADLQVNGLGTLRLLEWARQCQVERFIFTSSSCVYGNNHETAENTALEDFHTPYAIHKYLGELYCNYFHGLFAVPTIILRYFNCYGPGELPGKYRNVIPNFIALALQGKPLLLTGSGKETRDFNFVEEVVKKTLFIAAHPDTIGKTFNIGSGKEVEIEFIAKRINALVGNAAGIEKQPRRDWDGVEKRSADVRKFAALGYPEAHISLDEGLKKTIAYIKQRLPL